MVSSTNSWEEGEFRLLGEKASPLVSTHELHILSDGSTFPHHRFIWLVLLEGSVRHTHSLDLLRFLAGFLAAWYVRRNDW